MRNKFKTFLLVFALCALPVYGWADDVNYNDSDGTYDVVNLDAVPKITNVPAVPKLPNNDSCAAACRGYYGGGVPEEDISGMELVDVGPDGRPMCGCADNVNTFAGIQQRCENAKPKYDTCAKVGWRMISLPGAPLSIECAFLKCTCNDTECNKLSSWIDNSPSSMNNAFLLANSFRWQQYSCNSSIDRPRIRCNWGEFYFSVVAGKDAYERACAPGYYGNLTYSRSGGIYNYSGSCTRCPLIQVDSFVPLFRNASSLMGDDNIADNKEITDCYLPPSSASSDTYKDKFGVYTLDPNGQNCYYK